MQAHKRSSRILLAAAATAALTGVSTAPVLASQASPALPRKMTWTVEKGGKFEANSRLDLTFTDTVTKSEVICTTATAKGSFKAGSMLNGTGLGDLTSIIFPKLCKGPAGLEYTVNNAGSTPWPINAMKYAKGITTGTMTEMEIELTAAPGCKLSLNGTAVVGTPNGTVGFTYTNDSGEMAVVAAGSVLHFYTGNTPCPGFTNGDAGTWTATFRLDPKQTITSP
jgi:hypothetical protein